MVGEHFVTNVQLTQWTLSPISIDLENESFFSPKLDKLVRRDAAFMSGEQLRISAQLQLRVNPCFCLQ